MATTLINNNNFCGITAFTRNSGLALGDFNYDDENNSSEL